MSGLRDWVIEAVAAYCDGTGSAEQCREAAEAAVREGANLSCANLRGADLSYAGLSCANIEDATINWQSHDLIAEILRRAAGADIEKRKIAGFMLVSRDWCWGRFLAQDDPQRDWALGVLRKYVRDGDGAPDILRQGGER